MYLNAYSPDDSVLATFTGRDHVVTRRISVSPWARSASRFLAYVVVLWVLNPVLSAQRPELLYLRFNAGMGSVVVDQSIPGLPGTSMVLQNGISWDSSDPAVGGSSLRTDTALANPIPMCKTGAPVSYSGDWTLEFWAKKTVTSSGNTVERNILGRSGAGSFRIGYLETVQGGDALVLEGPNINSIYVLGGGELGVWQHIAFVHDSTAQTLTPFLDGLPQAPVVQNQPIDIVGDGVHGLIIGGIGGGHWPGALDEFRLRSRALSALEIQSQMNSQINAAVVDIAVVEIISPAISPSAFVPLSSTEIVTARISNLGSSPVAIGTAILISLAVNGGSPIIEAFILPTNLSTGESATFTFATTADLTGGGPQNLAICVSHPGDLQAGNDTRTKSLGVGSPLILSDFPLIEDFDGIPESGQHTPPLWLQDSGDGGDDWTYTNDPTMVLLPNGSTPQTDRTTGVTGGGLFALVESSAAAPDTTLWGPLIQLGSSNSQSLDFWLHSFNATTLGEPDNTLSVDILAYPSGTVLMNAMGPLGSESGPQWVMKSLDVTAFAGQIIQARFRVDGSMNLTSHDIAVDDVRVNPFGPGQAPQPGLSLFDLNSAMSIGMLPVSFLEPGPYLAFGMAGQPLNFHFEGQANQPIILLFGNYNPVAATFPNAGQMDIGGAVNPMTGLPTNIFALFDGNLTTGLNPLFKTNVVGENDVLLVTPSIPPGLLTTFQAAIVHSTLGIVLSNAIQLEIK